MDSFPLGVEERPAIEIVTGGAVVLAQPFDMRRQQGIDPQPAAEPLIQHFQAGLHQEYG